MDNAFFDWLLEMKYGTPEEKEKKRREQEAMQQQQQQPQGNALQEAYGAGDAMRNRQAQLNALQRY